MLTLPPKLEAMIEEEPDPRQVEAWFRDLPEEKQAEWTREWKDGLRRRAELVLRERRAHWRDALQMGLVWLVADYCTQLATPFTACANFALGFGLGWLAARLDLERLSTPLLIVPAWIALQVAGLHHLSLRHFFIVFPLGCAIAYTAMRRGQRAFE